VEENSEEMECEQVRKEKRSSQGDDGENREKSKGLECTGGFLCAAVVIKGGVVKPPERGVTRISPSDTRPGGENSAGTLPKFRKRETSEEVRLGS
jgi:hypothetical protein